MAAPALLPEDFDPEEEDIELEEPEEVEEVIEYDEEPEDQGEVIDARERFEELNKRREKLKEQKEAKEQEQLRTDDSKKPPKQEPENPELKQKKDAKAQDAADRVKSGEKKFNKAAGEKATTQGEKAAAEQVGKVAGKEAAAAGRQGARQAARAAGKATAQATKAATQAAAKAVQAFIVDNPYAWAIIGIIVLVVVIVAVIFALFAFSGDSGNGPATYPSTALEEQRSNFLLALSGDKIAQDTVVKDVIESELERYDRIINNASRYNSSLTSQIQTKKAEFDTLLNSALAEQNSEVRLQILNDVESQMTTFDNTLPIGEWIAKIAEGKVGEPNLQFCSITGATAKVACASFTSTVMYLAGVPNAIVASVDEVWNSSSTRVIVPKAPTKSATYYQENSSKLQPGDIIFWGDGACSPKGSVIFDHVGFYLGNGKTADTSSSQEKVASRSADKIDSCRVFNGAKRYGK